MKIVIECKYARWFAVHDTPNQECDDLDRGRLEARIRKRHRVQLAIRTNDLACPFDSLCRERDVFGFKIAVDYLGLRFRTSRASRILGGKYSN